MLQKFKNTIQNVSNTMSDQIDSKNELIRSKIREKALTNTQMELLKRNKTFDDFTDDELEIIIRDEEDKIYKQIAGLGFKAVLAILGLDLILG